MGLSTGAIASFLLGFVLARFTNAAAVLLGLMVFAGGAHAAGPGLPTNLCDDSCGPRQQQMWARFKAGESPDFAVSPRVYAGVCYVFGNNVNPDRAHHVGFMIDNHAGEHKLHLRFSFFTSRQPYDELTVAQAGSSFGAPVVPLSVHDGYAYAEVIGRLFFARYWFRHDRARERMLLVSYFGDRVTILCDTGANR